MDKKHAIKLLGGGVSAAAEAVGVSYQAVCNWPDQLPARIADRVQAVLYRRMVGEQPDQAAPAAESAEAGHAG